MFSVLLSTCGLQQNKPALCRILHSAPGRLSGSTLVTMSNWTALLHECNGSDRDRDIIEKEDKGWMVFWQMTHLGSGWPPSC